MAYYHDLITEKSWEQLQNLRRQHNFVLLGGWAVYLYTKGLKSRDIDLLCGYEELEKFRQQYELSKNDRLKKYEVHQADFDIDIYVPFYSEFVIPAEKLLAMVRDREGFKVLSPEVLLILKQQAWQDRQYSVKGEKDRIDILALLASEELSWSVYIGLLAQHGLTAYQAALCQLLSETHSVPELSLSEHQWSRRRKMLSKQLGCNPK